MATAVLVAPSEQLPRQFEDLPRQEAVSGQSPLPKTILRNAASAGTPAVRGDNRLQYSATFLQARVTQSSVCDALSPNLLLRFSGPVDDPFGFYRSRNPRD